MQGGATWVKPIQPMTRKTKHNYENSYEHQNNQMPFVSKRALSEQQKVNKMAYVTNQSNHKVMGRLSSNDSSEKHDK